MDVSVIGVRDYTHPYRQLICDLMVQFYTLGWVSGTGGGIALRDDDDEILVAPSGVQKERLHPEDLFVMGLDGSLISRPSDTRLQLSECWPLFQHAFTKRDAYAVIHSHSLHAVLATRIRLSMTGRVPEYFRAAEYEMLKGLRGLSSFGMVRVPIIENTEQECDLADSLAQAIDNHPEVDAVLVRNHGLYVWGNSWQQAKVQAECLDYLFKAEYEGRG